MRKGRAITVLILTTVIIWLLDRPLGTLPALGRVLDPVNGAWAAAEPAQKDFDLKNSNKELQQPVSVWFDARLVPHIRAASDHDLYFMQGYIHAYFRLWQMDLQTRAAGGRVSEILGKKALEFDRKQRRKGMVYGAERSLQAMEADPRTKMMLDAYTAGINSYIGTLNYRRLPLEYKLMGFKPEPWTNIKCALLLKYMADDLTGYTEDIPLTVLKNTLPADEFNALFPEKLDESTPVIPKGTAYDPASLKQPAAPPDSVAFAHLTTGSFEKQQDDGKGSNNWAVSGSRTQSGATILCNDPHLGLNLPSLWYEVQLSAPGINSYGVSLPGAPGIIIGFNDSISWGFTNNYRDVKDFYLVQPADSSHYMFAGKPVPYRVREEHIKIKGAPDFIDKVNYTVHGPVMWDARFPYPGGFKGSLALAWMAHRPSNELLAVYLLNRSNNYTAFTQAIQYFLCPAQNMVYADRQGNIALWGQGQFVNKWKGQGRYVMNGADSATLWKELIPTGENPHVLNPPRGWVSSANQSVTDNTYPYWYNGYFYEFRAWRINSVLASLPKATVQNMFALQNDEYSILAANVLPVLLRSIDVNTISPAQHNYLDMLGGWNYRLTAQSRAATVFQVWWYYFYDEVWKNISHNIPDGLKPSPEVTMQLLRAGTGIDDLGPSATYSFIAAADSLGRLKDGLEWYHAKKPMVQHLTKLPAFGYYDLPVGGWGNTPQAMKTDHGPSWRMVVQMGKHIEAYGVYPGGQSGNPGSKYYASFLGKWVKGQYYRLVFLPNTASQDNKAIKYTWTIKNTK